MTSETDRRRKAHAPARPRGLWIALAVLLALAAAALGYYLTRYALNREYRQYLQAQPPQAEAFPFAPLQDPEPCVAGFLLAAENDTLKLYVREDGQTAVYDRRSGDIVYSNPQGADSDPVANKTNRGYLKSQFILDYYNASLTAGTWDSFSMSSELNQVTLESIGNGVRFTYEVGRKDELKYFVPSELTADMYARMTQGLSDSDLKQMEKSYVLQEDGSYRIADLINNNVRNRAKTDAILRAQGFTEEDYWAQEKLAGADVAETLSFTVALEWRLREDGVEVTVPAEAIREQGGGRIMRIQLLRFMGAAGPEEKGCFLLPNGSGSLMRFNNGKSASAAYSQYIYDADLMNSGYTVLQNTIPARLPLLGICREHSAILATVERGASLASVTADVAGRNNSYNYAYFTFDVRGSDQIGMFSSASGAEDVLVLENDLYPESLAVRYTLPGAAYTGYEGLARAWRERLIAEGVLTPKAEGGDIPFYYDVLGGVKETAHTLGVQYLRVNAMTTFAQAERMAQALADAGVANQVMNFQGWMNGGYYHDVPDRVSVLRELGGRKGLESLDAAMVRLGGGLYADVAFQRVTEISRRYLVNSESSRYYGAGYVAQLGQVNPSTLRRTSGLGYGETRYYLLSPRFLPHYVQGFAEAAENIAITGISLRDLADQLHADKRRTEVISREQALDVVRAQLEILRDTGRQLLVSGGNDYSFATASHIINAPMSHTEFFILDECVPFYQMVLHGCVDYAGGAANESVSGSTREELLRLIEYGASPHYVFTWKEASAMKYTGLNRFASTTFATWMDTAAQAYAYVNGALAPVSAAAMLSHEALDSGVVRVRYDNGVTLYINHGAQPALADGLLVPALDYLSVGGARQ